MILDARDMVRQWREDSRGVDLDAIMQNYCDGYDDYEGENFYSDDDGEMSVETVTKDAKILADEKKNSDMSGSSLDADDYVRQWREDSRGVDLDAIMQSYCDGYADYEGENFYSDDDDEMSMMSGDTVTKDAKILADEKKNSDMSGTSLDTQSNFHQHTGDEEKVKMDIEGGASEENKATEGKKKEKRKLQEDGVESEQKDGTGTATEVKKKKDSVSKSDG